MWRERINTVDELARYCHEYESMCREEEQQFQGERIHRVNEINYDYPPVLNCRNPDQEHIVESLNANVSNRTDHMICWNCKDIGHTFTQCNLPQQHLFCYSCGASGVFKANCLKCLGNGRRGVPAAPGARPSITLQPSLMTRTSASQPNQQARKNQ